MFKSRLKEFGTKTKPISLSTSTYSMLLKSKATLHHAVEKERGVGSTIVFSETMKTGNSRGTLKLVPERCSEWSLLHSICQIKIAFRNVIHRDQ